MTNPTAAHRHPTRRYRCSYHPKDLDGRPTASESGVLPFIQLLACNAEEAQRKAFHLVGSPIAAVERLEGVA